MSETLHRFLNPRSVAVVGASERQERAVTSIQAMRGTGLELHLVNPNRSEAFGMPVHPSLQAIGSPVDAVLCLVSAELAVSAVADARAAGAGGAVVIAGGFSEAGEAGAELERQLVRAADGMPLLGPNCNGFVRPGTHVRLTGAPPLPLPAGQIGLVSQSGALLGAFGVTASERAVGISTVITTGNETALDLADCLNFLVDDPETRVIGLAVEAVRDPERFFAAARRAVAANKPVVAMKLGRSARGREITTSHTGAIAGEPWVYDAAFRQHGIASALDVDDLMDRLAILAQLPSGRWTAVERLGVMSGSGGWAALTGDIAAEEGLEIPGLSELRPAICEIVPDRVTVNPLDMTGFAQGRVDIMTRIADVFLREGQVDGLLAYHFLNEEAGASAVAVSEALKGAAERSEVPVILASLIASHPGDWARQLSEDGVAIGRGVRGTIRGLQTMGDFVRYRGKERDVPTVELIPRPDAPTVESTAGPMLGFGAAMELLESIGIPTAPYRLVANGEPVKVESIGFAGPYVVKLADVPHRTELGAVRVGVAPEDLDATVAELRTIAEREGVAADVVVQPLVAIEGEAFVGGQLDADLGPLVVSGLGGVLVEALGGACGRLAPLNAVDVEELLDEIGSAGVFAGLRGSAPWDRGQLADVIAAASRLTAGATSWLSTFDINPLVVTSSGFMAVDGLFLLKK